MALSCGHKLIATAFWLALTRTSGGKTSQILGLTARYPGTEMRLDGAFKAWAGPGVDETVQPPYVGGDYPFLFDCPTFGWYRGLYLPAVARVQLAAFAQKIDIYEDDLHQPIDLGEAGQDEEFFIPVGTFREARHETPTATALFGGRLLDSQTLENPLTGKAFMLATLRTYSMDIDILFPQNLVTKPLTAGQFISGEFWISGVIDEIIETFEPEGAIDIQQLCLECEVVGAHYQQDSEQLVIGLSFGEHLQLAREVQNPHDSNAIAVLAPSGEKLGYIPWEKNKELARLMDSGAQPVACLVEKRELPTLRLGLRIYLPDIEPTKL
jgi:hypothetical protein